jgi:ligand-binding SRPBCC domain-containing protein
MPVFTSEQTLPRPVSEVFDFFCRPDNLVLVSPPELHMRLVAGPERLQLGSRITLEGRRWGMSQQIVSEVIEFEPDVGFIDTQRQGPFKKWVHRHNFRAVPEGTRLNDYLEFEPPGGVVGLVMNARAVQRDLEWVFAYRAQKLEELLGNG